MVDALTSDCRVLLARFEEKQSVRFEDFCEVWKQMNFSLIHHAKSKEWERIQIVEYLFRILCSYMQTTCPLQYQVGAIYALYSIYNTQLVVPKVKIRMTLSMFNDLLELQERIKEEKHYDVNYVICSLRADKAFIFVAMPIKLACGSRDAISVYERELAKENAQSNAVQNVLETLQRIDEIDNEYKSLKMDICSSEDGGSLVDPVTLRVASDEFGEHLRRDFEEFQTWKEESSKTMKAKQMARPPELGLPADRKNTSGLEAEQTRVETLKDIKRRSYKSKVSKGKRRRRPVSSNGKADSTPSNN